MMAEPTPAVKVPWIGLVEIKWISLMVLVIQNTSLALIIKRSQIPGREPYISTVAVVMSELGKVFACLCIITYQSGFMRLVQKIRLEVIGVPMETLKLLIPSGLYTVQNNLTFVAISNLSAAAFQVTYQMKIITTAIFSVLMLNRKLTRIKWFALMMLVFGVAAVQLQPSSGVTSNNATTGNVGNPLLGLLAVTLACTSSGFAGVYFEKILKGTSSSIWVRNVQLGIFGIIIGLIGCFLKDGSKIAAGGFFQGFDLLTWLVVVNQALGGLIVAIVVKYADNIMKGFATSLAIIFSSLISMYLFDFNPSLQFSLGAALVIFSVWLYSKPEVSSSTDLPSTPRADTDQA